MATEPVTRKTISVPEAAQVLGISRRHAYEMARRGEIPSLRLGTRVVVLVDQLERLLSGVGDDDAAA